MEQTKPEKRLPLETRCCAECGWAGSDTSLFRCPGCQETLYDLRKASDVDFLRALFRQRTRTRFSKAGVAGFVSMFAIVLGLPFMSWSLRGLAQVFGILWFVIATFGFERLFWRRIPEGNRRLQAQVREMTTPPHERHRFVRFLSGGPVLISFVCLAVYAVVAGADAEAILENYAAWPAKILNGTNLWTLVTAGFLHAGPSHLALNMVGLWLFGRLVDLRIGRLNSGLLVLASSILGTLVHCVGTNYPEHPVVGISAGVYGLIGASLALMPRRKCALGLSGIWIFLPAYVVIPLQTVLFTVMDAVASPNIAWLGHLGGFASGIALGAALSMTKKPLAFEAAIERYERRVAELDN